MMWTRFDQNLEIEGGCKARPGRKSRTRSKESWWGWLRSHWIESYKSVLNSEILLSIDWYHLPPLFVSPVSCYRWDVFGMTSIAFFWQYKISHMYQPVGILRVSIFLNISLLSGTNELLPILIITRYYSCIKSLNLFSRTRQEIK